VDAGFTLLGTNVQVVTVTSHHKILQQLSSFSPKANILTDPLFIQGTVERPIRMLCSSRQQLIGERKPGMRPVPISSSFSRLIHHRLFTAGIAAIPRGDALLSAGRQFPAKSRGSSTLARIAELDKVNCSWMSPGGTGA
jgi:hypothetical protein